jgi:predicted kinase
VSAEPLRLTVPGLVVLVGAAGAGKSTLAARLVDPGEILSSDALRAAISGDPADQRATRPAFAILHRELRRRLAAGRLVVVDATNAERHARAALLRAAAILGVPARAVVLALPDELVQARNRARVGRVVPPDVVQRQLALIARLGDTPAAIALRLRGEGFAAVMVVTTAAELDALNAVRIPRREVGGRRIDPRGAPGGSALPHPPERPGAELHPDAVPEIDVGATHVERRLGVGGPNENEA